MEHAKLTAVLERARTLGVLGPGPVDQHIRNAEQFVDALQPEPGKVIDLGSGGGVPGLVIAVSRPDLQVVLLEAQERRVALLQDAALALELARVEVLHGRAEDLGRDGAHRHQYQAATARSFGAPAVVAECAAPFLCLGGRLLVSEPPDRPSRWLSSGLAELGLRQVHAEGDAIAVLSQETLCPDRFPRRSGIPAKRPLF